MLCGYSVQVTIKAMATSHDGLRESSVVTKTFFVDEARPEEEVMGVGDGRRGEGEEVRSVCPDVPQTCSHCAFVYRKAG